MSQVTGWQLGWASPFAWITRDLMLPVLWIQGWAGHGFTWRGNAMELGAGRERTA